jgi:hypothetical protein
MIISLLIVILVNCSGGRAAIKLEKAQVPISMSPFLYSEDGKVLVKNKDLKVLGKFEYEKRFWAILWSHVRLSDDDDVAEAINEQVNAKGGDGIISLLVESDYCGINAVPFLGILPIWPGCTKAKFQGEIVVADAKPITTLQPDKKEDKLETENLVNAKTKQENKSDRNLPVETKTDKPLPPESKIIGKQKPEIQIEENSLLDEETAEQPIPAKKQDKKVNSKKKNKGAK